MIFSNPQTDEQVEANWAELRDNPRNQQIAAEKAAAGRASSGNGHAHKAKPNLRTPRAAGASRIGPQVSDDILALRFSALHADSLRYVALWGDWLLWADTRWRSETTLKAFDLAREVCRDASSSLEGSAAKDCASAKTVAAVERLAKADRRHATTFDQWDRNDWLLNPPSGGTIELKTGEVREYRREDYITKLAGSPINPYCPIPLWTQFLSDITDKDVELQLYLQRMAGYCLTGSVREHAIFFLYGTGGNGKGVFLRTLEGIWGDYAVTASMDTFLETHDSRHPTELAHLHGSRLVMAQETEKNRRWAQSKLQALTGGDTITARKMRQDFFTFQPTFKLVIGGNHKPSLSSVDEAIKRRLNLVPFTVTIPKDKRDPDLVEKLKSEWPGILAWAVQGCLDWQALGLAPPACVSEASEAYFADEDTLTKWIAERCGVDKTYQTRVADLFDDWRRWAESANERPGSQKLFSQNLDKKGFKRDHNTENQAIFAGIALRW